ncbi:hypothetical protein H7686_0000235 [Candidatus Phytoplasma asiaticum]|uniref:Uncharacterized protein n=1 Tax=Candidatus Phytoplasma asiaticum TaxID=2763338 RepID=A0AAX3B9H0_9MOLU|nr:hypothetical protein ['Parthenium hysterophorus' phyllody phytoplasma]UQV27260.1 hypothetical protein H7686_0000235 ['Parthenium hysterophorus' phyllody phytoplasma]
MIDKNLDQINNVFEKKSSNNNVKIIKEISSSKKTLPRNSFGLKYVTSLFVASFGVVRVFVSKMIFAFR